MDNIIIYLKRILICVFALFLAVTGSFTVKAEETEETELTEETAEPETAPAIEDVFKLPEIGYETESTIPATGIYPTEQGTEISLKPNQSVQLEYLLEPADSDEKPYWYLNQESTSCLTFDSNGYVTATGTPGTCGIYAQISNGQYVYYNIYVAEDPNTISFDRTSYKIPVNQGRSLDFNTDTWESYFCRKHITCDDPTVISIGQEWTCYGVWVSGLKPGTATVTVTADNGVSSSAVVEVVDGTIADNIYSDETEIGLKVGDDPYRLHYQIYPENSGEKPTFYVNYANNNCVTVDENGVVTPLCSGDASVTAEITNGNQVNYHIYVIEDDPVSIAFNKNETSIPLGGYSDTLIGISIDPWASYYCRKHVVSDNPSVVSIPVEWTYEGYIYVHGESNGTATITVTADNGLTAQIVVTVKEGIANSIWASGGSRYYLHPYDGVQLQYSLSPDTATEKPVWSIESNYSGSIAAIDKNGYVIASGKPGYASVKATIENGDSAYYEIYVAEDPELISFKKSNYKIISGKYYQMQNEMIISPSSAHYAKITASVDNSSVCSIFNDPGGFELYGMSPGTAMLTVVAENGVEGTANITVVDGYASQISSNNTNVFLKPGESGKLEYSLSTGSGNLDNETVTFVMISGSDVITMSGDTVTAVKPGKAVVEARTAAYYDDELNWGSIWQYRLQFTIFVGEQPQDLHFVSDEYILEKNEQTIVKAIADSSISDFIDLEYTSDNPAVARVTSSHSGFAWIQGVSSGTATITATAENGQTAAATVIVTDDSYQMQRDYLYLDYERSKMCVGDTLALADNLFMDYEKTVKADISKYRFESENPAVISVEDGIVTANGPGTAALLVYELDNDRPIPFFYIQVYDRIDSFWFMQNEYTFGIADYVPLREILEINPLEYLVGGIDFISSNSNIVKVRELENDYWEASFEGTGDATITAISPDGKIARTVFHIVNSVQYSEINLDEETTIILHKNYTKMLRINSPSSAARQSYRIVTSDPDIVRVTNNMLEGVSTGSAAITIIPAFDPDQTVTVPVTVIDGDTDNYLYSTTLYLTRNSWDLGEFAGSGDELTCYAGNQYQITSHAEWTSLYGKEIPFSDWWNGPEFESENNCIIEVPTGKGAASGGPSAYSGCSSGMIFMALRPGTARIRTIGNHYATIHVVEETGAKLTISAPKTSIAINESIQLSAKIESEESFTDTVNWYTSDSTVVSVDQNGSITGLKEGKAIITARAGKASDSIEITVYGPLTAKLITEESIKVNVPTVLKAVASGGAEPYTYKFTVKVDGVWKTIPNPENKSEISYTFEETGIYSVCAAVTDAEKTTYKSQVKVTVQSSEPLAAELITEKTIYAGEATILRAEASGGTSPYKYQFTVKIDGVWKTIASGTEAECSYTFTEPGTYSLNVTVTDRTGEKVKIQKKAAVMSKPSEEPLTVRLVPAETIYAGEETVLKTEAAGGAEPYTYKFTVKIDGVWKTIASGTESECRYTFEEIGSYSVNVTVTDAAGTKVKSQKTITVTNKPSGEPLTAALNIVGTAFAGEEITLRAEAAGGAEPYRYQFTVKIDGVWQTIQSGTESEFSYTFTEPGTYSLNVTVTDGTGEKAKSQKKLVVNPAVVPDDSQFGCPISITASTFVNKTADDVISYYGSDNCEWTVISYNDSTTNPNNYAGVAEYYRTSNNTATLKMYVRWQWSAINTNAGELI